MTILERADRLGGFIASGEVTLPGFLHDTYSSWHPLFVSGAGYGVLKDDLHRHGLAYANTDTEVCATVSPDRNDRGAVVAYRDPVRTADAFEHTEDRDAYRGILAEMDRRSSTVFGALGGELGSISTLGRLGATALGKLGPRGLDSLARDAVSSGRSLLKRRFRGWEVDALWSPWLLHAGLSPDNASGGVMIPVLAAAMHGFGLPVVVGGAANLIRAFENLFAELGVTVRTGSEVTAILLSGGRVSHVRTRQGDVPASTVLASVTPQALYGSLLPKVPKLARQRDAAATYRSGRAAVQIHLALDRPVPWADERLRRAPLVHLTDGSGSTGIACAQAEAGLLPSAPTVVVGQQTLLDPGRAPKGKATLWLQLQEAPVRPIGDAAGEINTSGGWGDPALQERYLERVLDRIERVAPGFRATVLSHKVITPLDLEAANPNAFDGDPYSGSAELDQNLLWRPFPSGARHRTAVRGLWHIGASTHPGPGLGGGSGHLAAQEVLRRKA